MFDLHVQSDNREPHSHDVLGIQYQLYSVLQYTGINLVYTTTQERITSNLHSGSSLRLHAMRNKLLSMKESRAKPLELDSRVPGVETVQEFLK